MVEAIGPLNPRPRGFPESLPSIFDAQMLRSAAILTLETEAGEFDLMIEVPGVGDFDAVSAQSKAVSLYGYDFLVLGLPALIAAKETAGRPKDLLMLPALRALLEARGR
jgi:hypothetical protein